MPGTLRDRRGIRQARANRGGGGARGPVGPSAGVLDSGLEEGRVRCDFEHFYEDFDVPCGA